MTNVLLITIDSLRADRVLSEGRLTPTMDSLAEENVYCPEAVTHGQGTPVAFPSILTGTYPMLYGGCKHLSPERPILARQLSEAGFDTAAFTSNPHLFDKYGYEVGFDIFNQYLETGDERGTGNHSPLERIRLAIQPYINDESRLYNVLRRVYYYLLTATKERPYTPADEINDHVIDWLNEREKSNPFFAWVHYMDSHYPFYQDEEMLAKIGADPIPTSTQRRVNRLMNEEPSELTEEDQKALMTLYDAETRFVDEELDRLLQSLRDQGLYEDTIVIVTSDHGEALGEHGGYGHYKALYEELVRVPLILHIPEQEPRIVESQVGLADLAPTILDYLDEPISSSISGESLRPLIAGDRSERNDPRHVLGHGDPLGVRTSRWKYIWWDRDGDEPLQAELFDLMDDQDETTDVSAEHPEIVEEFDEYLADHIQRARETEPDMEASLSGEVDEEIEAQLEALGYQ